MAILGKLKDAANLAASKAKEVAEDSSRQMKGWKTEKDELKAPAEGAITRYEVTYHGGLPQYPKEKSGAIGLNIMPDAFLLRRTSTTKDWFTEDIVIPYDAVKSFEITKRSAGTWEFVLSNNTQDARATEVENVLAITYTDEQGTEILLRLEMLTGFNIFTQAKKCQELMDVLRQNRILERLKNQAAENRQAAPTADDPLEQLKKLAELKDLGVITEEEFSAKKAELLAKL